MKKNLRLILLFGLSVLLGLAFACVGEQFWFGFILIPLLLVGGGALSTFILGWYAMFDRTFGDKE